MEECAPGWGKNLTFNPPAQRIDWPFDNNLNSWHMTARQDRGESWEMPIDVWQAYFLPFEEGQERGEDKYRIMTSAVLERRKEQFCLLVRFPGNQCVERPNLTVLI